MTCNFNTSSRTDSLSRLVYDRDNTPEWKQQLQADLESKMNSCTQCCTKGVIGFYLMCYQQLDAHSPSLYPCCLHYCDADSCSDTLAKCISRHLDAWLLTVNNDLIRVSLELARLISSDSSPLLSVTAGVVWVAEGGSIGGVVGRLAREMCRGRGPGLRWRFLAGELGKVSAASLLFLLGLLPPAIAIPGIDSSASSIIRF